MGKKSKKRLEEKAIDGRGENISIKEYDIVEICNSLHHKYSSGTSSNSLKERMKIYERSHIPMTF